MSLSIYQPAFVCCSLSIMKSILLKRLGVLALGLAGCGASMTQADATLTYELTGSDANKSVKQFSIARFFVRIDDPAEAKRFMLFQAGRFFPVYAVDEAESNYRLLTPPEKPWLGPNTRAKQMAQGKNAAEVAQQQTSEEQTRTEETAAEPSESEDSAGVKQAPASPGQAAKAEADAPADASTRETSPAASAKPDGRLPAPTFKPSKKKRTVAGIRCRVVHELFDDKPVKEHCMANSAALGVTKREVITLSRLFAMARKLEFDWLGVGTKDEEFIAIHSRDLGDNRMLQLTSLSAKPLPAGYLRIPRSFTLVESDANNGDSASASKVD